MGWRVVCSSCVERRCGGERFHDKSDIDLVVDGLPPRLYFKALAELWRLLPAGMELDLILFEDADSELHERVVKEGVTLSE